MTEEPVTVTVKLLDREFLVGCQPDEREGLLAAMTYLDRKMREIRHASRSPGYDRVAVLADQELAVEQLDGDGDGFFGHGAALNWRSRAPSDARSWPRPAHAPARCAS